ncbi:MAG: tetratricopeptide repeat protein [Verrucomicrobia bacterium]|nr:tetratricopeptide repeat protein [Verrucomicrobiota bacterium]MCH8511708.1 tetratricopeptide repeat protein [Kiritimatiellia bacterium]
MATDFQHYSDTWHDGVPIVALPDGKRASDALARAFLTAPALGGIRGSAKKSSWHFEPGLPPGFDVQALHLLNCGYRITSREGADIILLQLRPGVFSAEMPLSVVPELFSTRQTVRDEESCSWLELDGLRLLMENRPEGSKRRRMALIINDKDADTQRLTARKVLDGPPPSETWAGLWKQRMSWLNRLGAEERPVMFDLALETLDAAVEPAGGPFSAQWLRDPEASAPSLNLNHLDGELPALARLEPEAARGVIETLSGLPTLPSGCLPAFVTLENDMAEAPAWPLLARAVLAAKNAGALSTPSPELCAKLEAHIKGYLATWDSEGTALPVWPDGDAAFTPEIFDEDLALTDLAAMLVSEIESLAELCKKSDLFAEAKNKLRKILLETHWSDTRGIFLDRLNNGDAGGAPVKRMTAGGLIPLIWKDLPDPNRRGILKTLTQAEGLRCATGLMQWEARPEDPALPPVRPELQHLMLQPLLRNAPPEITTLMGAAWAKGLDNLARANIGFPLSMAPTQAPEWHPLTAAFCLRFAPLRTKMDLELSKYPKFVRALERHRTKIVGCIAAIIILLPSTIGLHYATREDYSAHREQSEAGHAETLYTLGQYQAAAQIYTDLLRMGKFENRHLHYHFQRGKCHWHLGDYEAAKADFARAVDLDEDLVLPAAHWNLGQAQWRLGQIAQARATFEEVLDVFSEGYPDLGQRAAHALEIMDRERRLSESP